MRVQAGRARPLSMGICAACLTLVATSCGPADFGAAPPGERSLQVLPRIVGFQMPTGGVSIPVRLEAVLHDAYGFPETPGSLTWSSTTLGVTFASSGTYADVLIPGSLPEGAGVPIRVSDGSLSGNALIAITGSSLDNNDEALASHSAGELPSIALSSGLRGMCQLDELVAFVGAAAIGPWDGTSGCARSEAILFSGMHSPLLQRPKLWTSGPDVLDATTTGGTLDLPINVVIGVPTGDAAAAEAKLNDQLLVLSDVFHTMRVGISLPPSMQTTTRQELFWTIDGCAALGTLPTDLAPDAEKINVYVVRRIADDARGYFCAPNVILVSHAAAASTTLVHEVSHLLGLLAQDFGHTDAVAGFERDNVMSGYTGTAPGEDMRFRLTIGQVYRMHVDGRSWLRRAMDGAPEPLFCPCDPYAADACPALARDIRPIANSTPPPFTGTCS